MTLTRGRGDDIGRVVSAAEAHFQHERVGGMAREGKERRRRGDLEKGDRLAVVDALAFLERRATSSSSLDELAGETDALVEMHEMRRGVDVDLETLRFEHRARRKRRPNLCRLCRRHG